MLFAEHAAGTKVQSWSVLDNLLLWCRNEPQPPQIAYKLTLSPDLVAASELTTCKSTLGSIPCNPTQHLRVPSSSNPSACSDARRHRCTWPISKLCLVISAYETMLTCTLNSVPAFVYHFTMLNEAACAHLSLDRTGISRATSFDAWSLPQFPLTK